MHNNLNRHFFSSSSEQRPKLVVSSLEMFLAKNENSAISGTSIAQSELPRLHDGGERDEQMPQASPVSQPPVDVTASLLTPPEIYPSTPPSRSPSQVVRPSSLRLLPLDNHLPLYFNHSQSQQLHLPLAFLVPDSDAPSNCLSPPSPRCLWQTSSRSRTLT